MNLDRLARREFLRLAGVGVATLPGTTLFATYDPVTPDCRSAAALSKSRIAP